MTFDTFWAHYPIKKGKVSAQRAWNKLKPNQELSTIIMKALTEQKREKYLLAAANQFVPAWPHGSTWLNGARWEDETSTPTQALFNMKTDSQTILNACRQKGIDTLGKSRKELLEKLNA